MDALDRQILTELQADGRLSNATLAERVRLSPSPCLRRLKRLERDGLIRGYRAVLDRPKVGLGLTVFIELKVTGPREEAITGRLQEALSSMDEVVACHIVSGVADLLIEAVVPDLQAYDRFLMERLLPLPGAGDVRSNFVIRTVKADSPLPLGHLA